MLIWLYGLGFNKYPAYLPLKESAADISATILIPSRNPSQLLHFLLKQLELKLIKAENVEVFVIDDFSDKEIVLDTTIKCRILSLKQYRTDLSNTKNNKKEAIALGVEHSKHEHIICLDSDVTLSENWWHVVSNFIQDKKPKFAAGLHRYLETKTWLNHFLTLEQDILTASSIASLQLRIPTMCNGANMLFTKSAFQEVHGYDGLFHTNGGDDLFLYHRIYKLFPYDTHYIKNLDAAVYSEAPKTLSELMKQRSRWISKTNYYENKWVNVQGGIILITNILAILNPLIFIAILIQDFIYHLKLKEFYSYKVNVYRFIYFLFLYRIYVLILFIYFCIKRVINKHSGK